MSILEKLIKQRNRVVEEIGELLSMQDSINCDIAEARERLQELNDDVEATKDEEAKEAKDTEAKFEEVLKSGDYSALAREYRRLNKAIYDGRKRGWCTFIENTTYPSEGEVHQQRRDVWDRLMVIENERIHERGERKD